MTTTRPQRSALPVVQALAIPIALACMPGLARDKAPGALPVPASGVVGVEEAYLSAEFWVSRTQAADAVLMDRAAIDARNARLFAQDGSMFDLAALPKGPSNYHPFRHTDRAIERRNWVIDQMVDNGYVSKDEGEKAKATGLDVKPRRNGTYLFAGEYFTEEVRREIISRYSQ